MEIIERHYINTHNIGHDITSTITDMC